MVVVGHGGHGGHGGGLDGADHSCLHPAVPGGVLVPPTAPGPVVGLVVVAALRAVGLSVMRLGMPVIRGVRGCSGSTLKDGKIAQISAMENRVPNSPVNPTTTPRKCQFFHPCKIFYLWCSLGMVSYNRLQTPSYVVLSGLTLHLLYRYFVLGIWVSQSDFCPKF